MAHCQFQFQSCSARAVRSNNQPLFPSPSEGERYYIRAEVDKQTGSLDSHLRIEWNGTAAPYVSVVGSICKMYPLFYYLALGKLTHKYTVEPPLTASSLQWPFFFIPVDSPYIHSYINLSTMATSPMANSYPMRACGIIVKEHQT